MPLEGEARDQFFTDLRALVDYLEDHPEIPVGPYDARIGHSVSVDIADDESGAHEVRRIADALGEQVTIKHGHHDASIGFGYARYEATYIERRRMDAYTEFMKPYHEVVGQATS